MDCLKEIPPIDSINNKTFSLEQDFELIRYLAYSSWVNGEQGLMFFSLDNPEAEEWFPYCNILTKEAYLMKDFLLQQPDESLNDIAEVTIEDSREIDHRARFLLRRSQDPSEDKLLLMICNYSNDDDEHAVTVRFKNHTITGVSQIVSNYDWKYQPRDSNGDFVPGKVLSITARDIWARAFFIWIQPD